MSVLIITIMETNWIQTSKQKEKTEVGVEGGQRREGERRGGGQEQEWGGNGKTQIYQIGPLFPFKRWDTQAFQGLARDTAILSEHDAGPIALLCLN